MGPAGRTAEIYAEMLNASRDVLDVEGQRLLDEDTEKARAAMERAWLDAKPVAG